MSDIYIIVEDDEPIEVIEVAEQGPPGPGSGGGSADIAATINEATSKPTPADDDRFVLTDSASSFALRKLTWANIKAAAKTYFDTLYAAIIHTHAVENIINVGHAKLLGRHGAGTGTAQEIGIDGGLELHGGNLRRAAITGPVTVAAGGSVSAIADGALSIAMTNGLQSALNGKQATLTNYTTISALTGYPSSFPNDGVSGASSGGDGSVDTGRLVKFGAEGTLTATDGNGHPVNIGGVAAGHVMSGGLEGLRWYFMRGANTEDVFVTFPSASGELALTSQIPDISGKQDAITSETELTFHSFNCFNGTIEDLHVVMTLTLDNALTIANGGTGSTTAAGARTNLGAQATLVSGTNIRPVAGQSLLGSTNIPALLTDPTGITGAAALSNIVSLTQAQYNALGSKSATTLYVIT